MRRGGVLTRASPRTLAPGRLQPPIRTSFGPRFPWGPAYLSLPPFHAAFQAHRRLRHHRPSGRLHGQTPRPTFSPPPMRAFGFPIPPAGDGLSPHRDPEAGAPECDEDHEGDEGAKSVHGRGSRVVTGMSPQWAASRQVVFTRKRSLPHHTERAWATPPRASRRERAMPPQRTRPRPLPRGRC